MTSLINNLICCVYFPSYRSVAGPEVLQTEVVFVKVMLCQVLHNHNIYTFNLSVMAETAPTSRQKKHSLNYYYYYVSITAQYELLRTL